METAIWAYNNLFTNFLKKKLFTDTRVLFYFFCSLLLIVFLVVQSRIWFGDYSFSNLQQLKNQITSLEKESATLLKKNELLEGEKEKFSMGRNAIEGLARSELGLIKPGEIFYQFKEKESIEVIHNKTDESVD